MTGGKSHGTAGLKRFKSSLRTSASLGGSVVTGHGSAAAALALSAASTPTKPDEYATRSPDKRKRNELSKAKDGERIRITAICQMESEVARNAFRDTSDYRTDDPYIEDLIDIWLKKCIRSKNNNPSN
ncbi:unnamed protein product [Schistosoma margrebowiei]|uniref:Uncharacterized protein n=1 Tax=Schistosoma margrebowiei TaxID=48269 RepID=A0A183LQE2_9TREM|nr:unnamed protein product [Schistosoma margrebowiei]